mmetsp:Transcript_21295/g.51544  ORF Transcript_21295/g.51544 Transcript_21295/m.51544 type:complete len:277 (+) Transcript_21295:497-1327(+)
MCLENLHGCLPSSNVPDSNSTVRTCGYEDRLVTLRSELHILYRIGMALERLGIHIPATLSWFPEMDLASTISRDKAANSFFVWRECHRKALRGMLERLKRLLLLGLRPTLSVDSQQLVSHIPHVHCSRIGPRCNNVGDLRHNPQSVHHSRVRNSAKLDSGILIFHGRFRIAAGLHVVILGSLVQMVPLHNEDRVAICSVCLGSRHDVGSQRILGSLCPEFVRNNVEGQARPLHFSSVQHVVCTWRNLQLLILRELVNTRPPNANRLVLLHFLVFII